MVASFGSIPDTQYLDPLHGDFVSSSSSSLQWGANHGLPSLIPREALGRFHHSLVHSNHWDFAHDLSPVLVLQDPNLLDFLIPLHIWLPGGVSANLSYRWVSWCIALAPLFFLKKTQQSYFAYYAALWVGLRSSSRFQLRFFIFASSLFAQTWCGFDGSGSWALYWSGRFHHRCCERPILVVNDRLQSPHWWPVGWLAADVSLMLSFWLSFLAGWLVTSLCWHFLRWEVISASLGGPSCWILRLQCWHVSWLDVEPCCCWQCYIMIWQIWTFLGSMCIREIIRVDTWIWLCPACILFKSIWWYRAVKQLGNPVL